MISRSKGLLRRACHVRCAVKNTIFGVLIEQKICEKCIFRGLCTSEALHRSPLDLLTITFSLQFTKN